MPRTVTWFASSRVKQVQDEICDVQIQCKANSDEESAWPVDYALKELTSEIKLRIAQFVKKS